MKSIPTWLLFSLGSAFFAGLTAILGKVGVAGLNSNLATLIRTVVILLVTAGIVSLRDEWSLPGSVALRPVVFIGLSGVATGLSWLCYYRALKMGPASGVAPIDKMSVLLVALFAATFLGERLELRNWLGIVLIALGTIAVAA